jgi:putative tricarboxylic transport membrane protein
MRRADQVTGILMLIFAAAVMEGGRRMPQSNTFGPGAGFLPFWLGVLLAICSILLIVNATREPKKSGDRLPFPTGRQLLPILECIGGLAAFILLLEPLGFMVATALFTAFLLRVVEREPWLTTTLVSAGNAVGLYIVFQVLLGAGLPKNFLGF